MAAVPLQTFRASSLFLLLAAALAAGVPLATPAAAQSVAFGQSADTDAPVQVEADSLKVNQTTGEATFTGNVVIGQGEMRLSAGEVTVVYAGEGNQRISSLRATGGVTLVNGPDAAEASEAAYDVEAGTVALSGDVVLTQGQNVLSGQQASIDLNSGAATVAGRVRTVLQPGAN